MRRPVRSLRLIPALALIVGSNLALPAVESASVPTKGAVIPKEVLRDKIRGGWAGQTIGCTFGGPTEFRFQTTFIPDHQPISWPEGAILAAFKSSPGLYDDVYMDLTFVDVLEKEGLAAPAASFAKAFADAPYPLWHANQAARYNILHGLLPPASGQWLHNPHADDIDFQIEADFAGLMSPGMVGAAVAICDRVGRIMNSGDGWYGGVYVAAMYALAFVRTDVETIVEEALRVLPPEAAFARTIRTVIDAHRRDPRDWKTAWFAVQKAWGEDIGCPDGVFTPFNIEAKANCAWVVVGLLYGDGDFGRTLSISARCGDDSDCNPATAGGILGTLRGYAAIPEYWRKGLAAAEDLPFPYVGISLRRASDLSFKHALAQVKANGGKAEGPAVEIPERPIAAVPLETAFAGHFPVERRRLGVEVKDETTIEFAGIGFVVTGESVAKDGKAALPRLDVVLDGKMIETVELPTDDRVRRDPLVWAYSLTPGKHVVRLKRLEGASNASIRLGDLIVYDARPRVPLH
jgi:hypothetical protein